ncbi:hypothetical protein [Streptomyces sp. NPDC053069]|uniref:hypothetical protein n=1 Tax=Streptomyces sp. NPDC053069 TaxID=3365695 RepID=UPI0037D085FF
MPQQPARYPKVQGAFLRDRLGTGCVSVGLTCGRGGPAHAPLARTRSAGAGPADPQHRHRLSRRPPGHRTRSQP